MVDRRMIVPKGLELLVERYRYAPGVLVGDTLYVSGQVGRDANLNVIADPEEQFEQIFRNIGLVLDEAGFAFSDVVELESWFLRFPADLATFMRVKDRWITGPVFPTWTGFGVASFSMEGLLCEVKVTAVRGGPK